MHKRSRSICAIFDYSESRIEKQFHNESERVFFRSFNGHAVQKEESLFSMPRTLTDFSNCVSLGKRIVCITVCLFEKIFIHNTMSIPHGKKEFHRHGMHTSLHQVAKCIQRCTFSITHFLDGQITHVQTWTWRYPSIFIFTLAVIDWLTFFFSRDIHQSDSIIVGGHQRWLSKST